MKCTYHDDLSNLNLALCRDGSMSGHSVTIRETLTACSVEISGATAYEVSGSSAFRFCTFFLFILQCRLSLSAFYVYDQALLRIVCL